MIARKLSACMLVVVLTASAFAIVSFGARANEGLQDAYGYYWTDSNAPEPTVVYSWIDITATGSDTYISGDDGASGPFEIGFPFEFYGNTYTMFNVTTNGFIQFDSQSGDYSNDPIPSTNTPNNIIAPYWDDLCVDYSVYNSGTVYYETIGVSPDMQLVVEFYQISRLSSYDLLTFEIVLSESGEILFQYQSLSGMTGSGASVGIEDITGTAGCQYSYNQAALTDGLAVLFDLGPIGLTGYSEEIASWDATAMHTLSIRNNQAITDSFDLTYTSMVGWTVTLLDGAMTPLVDNNLEGNPDTGDLVPGEAMTIIVLVDVPADPVAVFEMTNLTASSFADPGVTAMSNIVTYTFLAQFGTTHYDYADDYDTDGDYDELYFDLSVYAIASGDIALYTYLEDGDLNYMSSTSGGYTVPAGWSYITVDYDGEMIFEHGVDGPFNFSAEMYSLPTYALMDGIYGYATEAYLYADFDPPMAYFYPPHSSSAVDDDDANTQYESLVVSASVVAEEPGWYHVDASLYAVAGGFYVCSVNLYTALVAGPQTVNLSFSSVSINESGVDGPYFAEMFIYDEWYSFLDSDEYYETDAYTHDEFEGARVTFVTPFDETTEDTDLDTLFNSLTVTVHIDCVESNLYDLWVDIYDPWWNYVPYSPVTLDLTEGMNDYDIVLDSSTIWMRGISGYYYFYLYLYDNATGNMNDNSYHESAYYDYTTFDPYSADFGAVTDIAVDLDLDGYYDLVLVNATVDPLATGHFVLEAYVYDYYGWGMYVTESVDLEEGVPYYFEFVIPGYDIYLQWLSTPFDIYLYSYDETVSYNLDYLYHETAYYYPGDFDIVDANIDYVDDEGVDTDDDGLFNELVMTTYILPEYTGYYMLYAEVYDNYYSWLMDAQEVVYLEEGVVYEWEIVVTNEEYISNGVDGSLYLYVVVYSEDGYYWFDDYGYYTSYYYMSYFDPIGAFFLSPFEEYLDDDDSDGFYDSVMVVVQVEAASTGYYDVEVYIYDPWYNYQDTQTFYMYLEEGQIEEVVVEITSTMVRSNDISGYWYLEMYTYDHYSGTYYDYGYHTTSYLDVYAFDALPVAFDPPHTDYVLDTDGDYYYDYLVVEVELNCEDPGTYTVYAELYGYYSGEHIASLEVSQYMVHGNAMVEFNFEGWMIYHTYDYDYLEVYLTVEDSDGFVLDEDSHWCSDYYYYSDFEEPPAELYPPYSDYAVDDDADLLYEYLVVNVSVEAYALGDYIVYGMLRDGWGYDVDSAMALVHLEPGVSHTLLWFDAWPIVLSPTDPYLVDLYLFDADWNEMDDDTYYLDGFYPQSDFDSTPPTIDAGWAYVAPAIDGAVGLDEWFGAAVVDVLEADWVNGIAALMMVMNDGENLYILVDATGDLTRSDSDYAAVAFDTGNDESYTDMDEDQFIIEATSGDLLFTGHLVFDDWYWEWEDHCAPFDPLLEDHEGLAGAAGFDVSPALATQHRIYEFSIPLALLGVVPGDDIGFAGLSEYSPLVMDGDEDAYSTWPVYVEEPMELYMYGDLILSEEPPFTAIAVSGSSGSAGWYVSDVDVTLTATGGTGGVDETYYNLDGAGWVTYSAPFAVEGDGEHTLEYYSTDVSGNDEPVRTAMLMIDTVAPDTTGAVVDGTPGEGDWFISEATVTFTVVDATSGLFVVMYRVDGGEWTELSGSVLTVSEDGDHTVEYYAVDIAGNEEAVSSVSVMVDTGAPVTVASVDGSSVTLLASDGNGSGVAATMYRIDGGDWVVYDGEFVVKGSGTHTLEYYSVDVAGNNETVKSVSVEGKAGILGLDLWVWAVIFVVIVVALIAAFFLMKRKPKQPVQLVPGQAVVEPMVQETPPPPPA